MHTCRHTLAHGKIYTPYFFWAVEKNEHFLFSFFGQVKLKTPTEEQSEERPY